MISATIIADSISPEGIRLPTVQYCAHRYVLAEINTHRDFSRNARSSRAVPTKRLIEEVRNNPAMPLGMGKNRPGMQATEALDERERSRAEDAWRDAASDAADAAERLLATGLHKQHANRVLEPFLYTHGLISSTQWANWEALRIHKDAQPEIRELAACIFNAMQTSTPRLLQPGEWHLPYVAEPEIAEHGGRTDPTGILRKLSVVRCARVSYTPFDGNADVTAEIERYDRLITAKPVHASPAEHQATPDRLYDRGGDFGAYYENEGKHRNFRGWIQYRATLEGDTVYDERKAA